MTPTTPRPQVVMIALLAALLVATSVFAVQVATEDNRSSEERAQARYTICLGLEKLEAAWRADVQARIRRDEAILADPEGAFSPDTRAAIKDGVIAYRETLTQFVPDDCVAYAHLKDEQLLPVPSK